MSAPAGSSYSQTVLATAGLVSYWRLGEASGTSAADSKGTNTGTYQGGFTLGQPGIDGSAVLLNGTTGFVSTATSIANPQAPFSLECWFKTTATSVGLIQFADSQTGTPVSFDRHLYAGSDGKVYFGIYTTGGVSIASSAAYNDGNWHHVAGVLASNNNMTLYVDGSSVASNANTAAPVSYTGFWRFGLANGDNVLWPNFAGGAHYLNGTLAHCAFYNAALSAATVQSHYNAR